MIRINDIRLPLGSAKDDMIAEAAKTLGIPKDGIESFTIVREGLDCRGAEALSVCCAELSLGDEQTEKRAADGFLPSKASYFVPRPYVLPENRGNVLFRPVIAGFGPAGMFCALALAQRGLKPIVLERGRDIDSRARDVETFWKTRVLDVESNVQFGEGGAGTFSDGKLNTGIKDARVREILRLFVEYGAPEEIAWSARPHIGTDRLRPVVKNIRNKIISLGGEVRFGSRLDSLYIANGAIQGVRYADADGGHDIETDCLVLCTGHSARDTFAMLRRSGLKLERKAFSVGTRIEHPQELIDRGRYGRSFGNPLLPPADYKFADHPPHGRGCYTFCMCPGGTVVAAASEQGGVAVNGMSFYSRGGRNANSALLIGLEPDYFPGTDVFAGVEFQRGIERAAFRAGECSYMAPCQLTGDFLAGRRSASLGSVAPTCPTGVVPSDMTLVLPPFVTDGIKKGIKAFAARLDGFDLADSVLTFPESRSTSPVRVVRDEETAQSNIKGVYPCGEGAGYAGGITSAAVDGLKCAEKILDPPIF